MDVRSDILLASSPQCPLPFLPPSLLPSRSASLLHRLVFSLFTLNLRFSSPATLPHRLFSSGHPFPRVSYISFLSFLLSFSPSPLMCMLCHIPMILSLFHSLALVGSIASPALVATSSSFCQPLRSPSFTVSPLPLFSLSLWLIR